MKRILLLALCGIIGFAANAQDEKVFVNDRNAQPRNVAGSFSAISVAGSIDLYLSQSDEEVVVVSAAETKYRDRIVTEVINGELKIYYNDKGLQWSSGNKKLKAYVSFKTIQKLTASGASDVYVNGVVKADALKINLSGSSDFKGAVDVNHLSLDQSGSSDSRISGRTANLKIEVSGASDVKGYDLAADYCEASASGASDIQITVTKELTATASGASDIYYKGQGITRNIKSSGASSVARRD
ncbi:head GIN domain-containing protein [Agriterribacter sp.]|uniref:head GIN domain-containing protein n=1 Tax=Agriterribacter sp. TaxID=2821509 RepID=UPI002B5BC178|nr:head GIN domain-containing protein [Agriterribacter sp.]HRO45094.1 head GIN domain-containing protein [Agriterribacter sp.]HRQ15465.1 head GIN domain-containing protein [Agriterribacter sp.]